MPTKAPKIPVKAEMKETNLAAYMEKARGETASWRLGLRTLKKPKKLWFGVEVFRFWRHSQPTVGLRLGFAC